MTRLLNEIQKVPNPSAADEQGARRPWFGELQYIQMAITIMNTYSIRIIDLLRVNRKSQSVRKASLNSAIEIIIKSYTISMDIV